MTISWRTTRSCRHAAASGSGSSGRSTQPAGRVSCGPSCAWFSTQPGRWPTGSSGSSSRETASTTSRRAPLQQSGALPAVTAQLIADLATDSEHGLLGSRVAKAVFIIGKLPKDGPSATGLRATNDTIADLLIEDLRADGARIRERVPVITKRLAERGILLEVDGAYLLQTPAAAEWAADYQAHVQDLRTDVRWQSDRRAELLREAFGETERTVKPRQGQEPRRPQGPRGHGLRGAEGRGWRDPGLGPGRLVDD